MQQKPESLKKQVKKNIKFFINNKKLEESLLPIDKYCKKV